MTRDFKAEKVTIHGQRYGDGECFCIRGPHGEFIYPNAIMDLLEVKEGRMYRFTFTAVPVDTETSDAEGE